MKLYATTTSERASKGQGGNKKIEINLTIDAIKRLEIGTITMEHADGIYTIYYYPINTNCVEQKINSGRVLLYQTIKGEKQKTAKHTHLYLHGICSCGDES